MIQTTIVGRDPQDLDLEDRVANFLSSRPFRGLQRLSVRAEEGVVTLRGRVTSYYERQLAQQLVRRVAGVVRLIDELEVELPRDAEANSPEPTYASSNAAWLGPLFIALLMAVAAAGCSRGDWPEIERLPTQPVRGQVTYQGQPIPGAFVVFHPRHRSSGELPTGRALVGGDGTFVASTYQSADGVVPGEYAVTVSWHKLVAGVDGLRAGPNVLPDKYSRAETTDIIVEVASGHAEIPPIAIK